MNQLTTFTSTHDALDAKMLADGYIWDDEHRAYRFDPDAAAIAERSMLIDLANADLIPDEDGI